jgi:hypothetical protein
VKVLADGGPVPNTSVFHIVVIPARWEDRGEVFRVDDKEKIMDPGHFWLVRYGYGVLGAKGSNGGKAYGNGALIVKKEDLIPVPEELVAVMDRILDKDWVMSSDAVLVR